MIASTQTTNTETFAFIAVLVFLSYWVIKFSLQTEKTVETVKKYSTF